MTRALERLVALRRALPRVRGARAAPAAPRSRGERTPLWAQRKRAARSARGRVAPPRLPDRARDVPRVPARRVRPAGPRGPAARRGVAAGPRGHRRHARALAVRGVASSSRSSRNFIYDGDAPLAERRAQALAIDLDRAARAARRGRAPRSCSTPTRSPSTSAACSASSRPGDARRRASTTCSSRSATCRSTSSRAPVRAARTARTRGSRELARDAARSSRLRVAGESRFVAAEDAATAPRRARRRRCPPGLPAALPRAGRGRRCAISSRATRARTARSSSARRRARASGVDRARGRAPRSPRSWPRDASSRARSCRGATQRELCDARCSTRSDASRSPKLRRAIEPVDAARARAVPPRLAGRAARAARARRAARGGRRARGLPPRRVGARDEHPARRASTATARWDLDALCAPGEVVWAGVEPLGASDGRIALYLAEHEALLDAPATPRRGPDRGAAVRDAALAPRGAVFFAEIAREVGGFPGDVLDALWEMVWAGEVTNDTLEPLRSRARAAAPSAVARGRTPRHPRAPRTGPAGQRGPLVAARVAPRRAPRATPTGAPRSRARCSIATACVTREAAHAEGDRGRLRGRLRRAQGPRGPGARAPRLLRRGARRGAVRAAGRRRSPARARDARRRRRRPSCSPRPIRRNAWGALLEWPAPPAATRDPSARPARSSCSATARSSGGSGAAGHALLTFCPRRRARASVARAARGARRRRVDAACGRSSSRPSTACPPRESPLAGAFVAAGFSSTLARLAQAARRRTPTGARGRRSRNDPPARRHARALARRDRPPSFRASRSSPSATARLQRAIASLLAVVTLGGQRHYLTRYHTVLFGKLYVPDAWDDDGRRRAVRPAPPRARSPAPAARAWATSSWRSSTSSRILPARPRLGTRAHRVGGVRRDDRATAELHGLDAARALEDEIVRRLRRARLRLDVALPRDHSPLVRTR